MSEATNLKEPTFAAIDLCQRVEYSSQLACHAPSFSHRRHVPAIVPQGKHIPAGIDSNWPACMFERGLRKVYQHQITSCKQLVRVRPACLRHDEQYHLHQPKIRLLDGVLAVR